ncbi:MAG: hydroxymethylbilane synthase, partial [Bacilli bacterium]
PRDVLISRQGCTLATLPRGAAVGTSSLRRAAQLLHARPDLQIRALRGNIDSRLRKLAGLDAIVLAAAGLLRMGWWDGDGWGQDGDRAAGDGWRQDDGAVLTALPLSLADMLPAVGQGALALEARAHDEELTAVLRTLHDSDSAWQIEAERAFLATVGGSCQAPIAAYGGGSEVGAAMGGRVGHGGAAREGEHDGRLSLSGLIGSPDGRRIVRAAARGPDAAAIGRELAEQLLEQGGREILEGLRTGQTG